MTNLELVRINITSGNNKIEKVVAMSTSYSALEKYCLEEFKKEAGKEIEHWTEEHYIIRPSKVVLIKE